jgi:hypothetical protein
MTVLTEEEVQRVGLLYDLLDQTYAALREFSRIQRAAILCGCPPATLIADMNLVALSVSNVRAWTEIRQILAPKPEPAAEPPAGDPAPKEVIQ